MCFKLYPFQSSPIILPGVLGLRLYSGLFALYSKCQSNKSRKRTIVFYALCLLYVLSTATIVCDFVVVILQIEVSNNSICKNIKLVMQYLVNISQGEMIIRLGVVQAVVSGCSDFIAQCTMVRINHSQGTYLRF